MAKQGHKKIALVGFILPCCPICVFWGSVLIKLIFDYGAGAPELIAILVSPIIAVLGLLISVIALTISDKKILSFIGIALNIALLITSLLMLENMT